jgi:DNA sulfur modification protein DndD
MILERIVLHDVGVYRGEHVIDLAPPTRQKPIILFGGLNGGGKTTLLDALQLVLYGRAAACSNRGALGYEELLRRSIHRGVEVRDGAAIELDLTHTVEGKPHVFRVRRSWSARDPHVPDRLEVSHDGAFDPVLTDAWSARIEEILPVRLSALCFFDGEKIAALADPTRSAEALSAAIHVLLGLDIVDQLMMDLEALERRKQTERKSARGREALEAARQEAERLAGRHRELVIERGSALVALQRAERALLEAEERFELGGGDAFERQRDLEDQRAALEVRVRRQEDHLRQEAGGAAPLLLVAELLELIHAGDEAERARREVEAVGATLVARDRRTLAAAEAAGATQEVLGALAELFARDRRHERSASASPGLGLSPLGTQARSLLVSMRTSLRTEVPARIARLLGETERLIVERDGVDRRLAGVPAEEMIAALSADRARAGEELERTRARLRALDVDVERTLREEDHRRDQYRRLLTKNVEEQVERQSSGRILTHAARVRETMARFRGAVLDRRVRRIEQLILEGFQHLRGKESLVSGLRVDPETFAMTLVAVDGRDLSPERLSAGERQLLAVSTLWGLARASGRPLPVMIDAALGRLDSAHRQRLLERYIPHASHQVILLATDAEIDEASYAKLEPSIGRAYTLRFDDLTASTTVEPGYFR